LITASAALRRIQVGHLDVGGIVIILFAFDKGYAGLCVVIFFLGAGG